VEKGLREDFSAYTLHRGKNFQAAGVRFSPLRELRFRVCKPVGLDILSRE